MCAYVRVHVCVCVCVCVHVFGVSGDVMLWELG